VSLFETVKHCNDQFNSFLASFFLITHKVAPFCKKNSPEKTELSREFEEGWEGKLISFSFWQE
jgi:hypothetical protein